ncbi:MAG: 4Fe-4S binding protein [SAR324 cluster bacterium]|nr:4Fe-4S binding protein [SAR324 cluster bacterium]
MGFVNFESAKESSMDFGGLPVEVVEAPRGAPSNTVLGTLPNIRKVLFSLFKGMSITLRYLLHPSTVVTQQYPENRNELKMFDRYRARLKFTYNEAREHHCTGCLICEMVCPNASIIIHNRKGPVTGKKEIDHFLWRWDICTFCNACVVACPHNALEMTGNFESAVYDRRLLIYNLNAYAGPPANALKKIEDPEERKKAMEARDVYCEFTPMAGASLPGIAPLAEKKEQD